MVCPGGWLAIHEPGEGWQSIEAEDGEFALTSVTFKCVEYWMHTRSIECEGVDPLSDADGTCKLGCQLEGLDPERQMTDCSVAMAVNLSVIPCESMQ